MWEPGKSYGTPYFEEKGTFAIKRKRSCTDVICFLLFLVFLAGWGFIAFLAFKNGEISRVIYPTDSDGLVCGQGQMARREHLLLFDMTQCLNPAVLVQGCLTPKVCVEKCPEETYSPVFQARSGKNEDEIKKEMEPFCKKGADLKTDSVRTLVDKGICPPWYLASSSLFGYCLPTSIAKGNKTIELVRRVGFADVSTTTTTTTAVPTVDIPNEDVWKNLQNGLERFGSFLAVRQFGERIFSDLMETWWMIALALLGATVFAFIWIILMRFLTGPMVYTSILAVFVGLGSALGYCAYRLHIVWQSTDPETHRNIFQLNWTPQIADDFLKQRDTWIAFTSILGIIFLIVVCLFIFLWQRIRIAIELIKQGSKAVAHMFSSLFFPIIPFLLQLVVVAWFMVVALFLSSWGITEHRIALTFNNNTDVNFTGLPATCNQAQCKKDNGTGELFKIGDICDPGPAPDAFNETCGSVCPAAECQFVKYTENADYSWMQFINIFGLLWGTFFFTAFGELVLAGVFAEWYWAPDKSRMPGCVLGSALWNATFYHLGTVAFGSLVIAIIRMIRLVLEYVEKKCKKFNNDLTNCLLKCCQCCLWCLEKFMRFINRNAYIMCAIKSTNFCSSAKDAFSLLMRNLARVVVLDSVVDFLLFLGKLVIVLATGAVSYLAFAGYFTGIVEEMPNLNYVWTPVAFIVVGSYCIASMFFKVYEMAVDTLFLCFLEDLERNDGSLERPYSMSTGLQGIVGKMNRLSQRQQRHR